MGIFDGGKGEKIDSLIKEVYSLRNRLSQIEDELEKSPDDHADDSRQASKKTSEYRNRARETKEEAESILSETRVILESAKNIINEIGNIKSDIESVKDLVHEWQTEVANSTDNIDENLVKSTQFIQRLEGIKLKYPNLDNEIEDLNTHIIKIQDTNDKATQVFNNITKLSSEINALHRQILGFVQEDENGEKIRVNGLKDELNVSYNDLESRAKEINTLLLKFENDSVGRFNTFHDSWNNKYVDLAKKIKDLLPDALTAGLSSAFSQKRKDEEKQYLSHESTFKYGIYGLVGVSTIPFIFALIFLKAEKSIIDLIPLAPRIVFGILPLYIPVLWFTYSANKKMNLSKRLIEEYSHKEVLSKTFEGLSSQIRSIDDSRLSNELRIKLLSDFLFASSENPGKLISDYEKSDHPVMDALEKSYKLETAISKLSKIPGLSKLSKVLNKRAERTLDDLTSRVEAGIDDFDNRNKDGQV